MSEYIRRVTEAQTGGLSQLAFLDVELTERCNNRCIHCSINLPEGDDDALAREMPTSQVKGILEEAALLGCVGVRFTGGEPLIRPDFEEIYLHARNLGLRVTVFTNGRLVDERLADLLQATPPLAPVEISVYGMTAASYEAVTGVSGSYAQFRRGVELLLERGVPFVVKSALLPPNRAETDLFESWAKTIPSMTEQPRYAMCLDLRARRDDAEKNLRIRALRVPPDEVVAMLSRDTEAYRREMALFRETMSAEPDDRLFLCGAGSGLSVDAFGRAQPCLGVRDPSLTVDLSTGTLAEALERFKALRDLRATDRDYLRRCARCRLRNLCEQCPAKSWTEHGTLDTPVDYLCDVAHAQARWLGWLGEGEYGWDPPESAGL